MKKPFVSFDEAILPGNINACNNKGLSLKMLNRSNQEDIWCFDKAIEKEQTHQIFI